VNWRRGGRFGREAAGQKARQGGLWLLLCSVVVCVAAWAGSDGRVPTQHGQRHDSCLHLLDRSTSQLHQLLEMHLTRRFPVTAQLPEGNARLTAPSLALLDCDQQRIVVSSRYEFRGNIGVMDLTRRGAAVIQLRLRPQPEQRQVRLEDPTVLDITFDNPAPWFDGKAITSWVLELFATPLCARLQNGQPC
jgi:hypothetical protein